MAGTNKGVFINGNKKLDYEKHSEEILHMDELCSDEESEHSQVLINNIINK